MKDWRGEQDVRRAVARRLLMLKRHDGPHQVFQRICAKEGPVSSFVLAESVVGETVRREARKSRGWDG